MSLINKLSIAFSLLIVLPQPGVMAWDVLVDIRGEIVGNSCTVSSDSAHIKVDLGIVSTRQLSGPGSVSNTPQPFTLNLENCSPTFSGAKIRFIGTADNDNPQLLQLTAGGASGAAIEILDVNDNTVALNSWSEFWPGNGDGTATLTFSARLQATKAPVQAGEVSALATWEVEYQ